MSEQATCRDCEGFADARKGVTLCRLHAKAMEMLVLLDEISVPEAFPEWDRERRALLKAIEGEP